MILFVTWLASVKSKRIGKCLEVDTISQYHSMLKAALSTSFGFELEGSPQRLPAVLKSLRNSCPGKERRKRRGLRRRHLKDAWVKHAETFQPKYSKDEKDAKDRINKWAAISLAWQALARGGEISSPSKRKKFRASRLPSRADISFHKKKSGKRYAVIRLRPLKKKGKVSKIPIIFAEGDHGGADTYWALRELDRIDPVPSKDRAKTPLFRITQGPLTQREFSRMVKKIAAILGLDPELFGGHSCRIGGATDCADGGGSPLLLQAKGRWASDIGKIYARMTLRAQLSASKLMQKGKGSRDLEDIFPDFTQPAL